MATRANSKYAVLDTTAYSHIDRHNPELTELLKKYARIIMPLNTLAELRSGYRMGMKEPDNLRTLNRFLSRPEVGVMVPGEDTLEHYVLLHTHAKKRHCVLSHNDLWIAAAAEQLQYDLITFDHDFKVFQDILGERLHILYTPKA